MNKNCRCIVFFLTLLLLICAPAIAQEPSQTGQIAGTVEMADSGQAAAYAVVRIPELKLEVLADDDGKFVFKDLPPGTYSLEIQDDAFKPFDTPVTVKADTLTEIRCRLESAAYVLDEVVVEEEEERVSTTEHKLSREEMSGVAGAGNDPIRAVEALPGVAYRGLGGDSGLVIRGTSPEDSSYLLNDFEIPQLFHFGSLISVINAELIDEISYFPGDYSVKYGQAIGGIVEVSTRSPRSDRIGGVIDLATYSSYAVIEGPIGEHFRFAGAVRRSFVDFILPEFLDDEQAQFTLLPKFYDYTALAEADIGSRHTVELLALGSNDQVGVLLEPDTDDPFSPDSFNFEVQWHRADLRWTFIPNSKLVNSMAINNTYVDSYFRLGRDNFFRSIGNYGVWRDDLTLALGAWNELNLGTNLEMFDTELRLNIIRPPKEGDTDVSIANDESREYSDRIITYFGGAYVEDIITPARWLRIVPGVRGEFLAYNNSYFFDPRLTLKFFPTEKATIKAGTGIYHQWPQADELLEEFGNEDLEPEASYLGNLGFEYDFGMDYSIDLQGYYKRLTNLVSSSGNSDVYDNKGEGQVYGLEFLARKKLTDRFFGWISYTYSVSRRKDRPDSDWRYFDSDQPHNFIILASYILGQNRTWRLGAKWQYSSGLPYTKIDDAIYNADSDSYTPLYSEEVNGQRNPDHHQLDVRIDKYWFFKNWTLSAYIDAQNVYFMNYPFGYTYNYNYTERQPVSFPTFYPSIGLQGRF